MRVHLVNPSDVSFGIAIITPRWLYVLAAATPAMWGDPILTDETFEVFDPTQVEAGDVVGIGIHTANALRGYQVGRLAREQGVCLVYGGIHATLYPDEAHELGGAHASHLSQVPVGALLGGGKLSIARLRCPLEGRVVDVEPGAIQVRMPPGGRIRGLAQPPAPW